MGTTTGTGDPGWLLGAQFRHKGSIHKDIWRGKAVDLAERGLIAVYPVKGWWRIRTRLGRYDKEVRYALVVSIRAPEVDVDIYNEIVSRIPVAQTVQPNLQESPHATSSPSILRGKSPAAWRDELEELVINDLLGPAGGPYEEVDEPQIQERYLAGKLAPRDEIVQLESADELAVADESSGENGSTEPNTLQGDGLYPRAIGLSFTIDDTVTNLHVSADWGWYNREKSEEIPTDKGNPKTVWHRYPMSDRVDLTVC